MTPLLTDHPWDLGYTRDDGDMVARLFVPLLARAVRYDRLTGYFTADALALAARGIEGLLRNKGSMRLVVGCTLGPEEVAAIEAGEALRATVGRQLASAPLEPSEAARPGLQLLAWLVGAGRLQVKVAVRCDARRRPVASGAIYHEKAGVAEDAAGNRVAFAGSLNETVFGWTDNYDSLDVFTSWQEGRRVDRLDAHFAKLWADQSDSLLVVDVPQAARDDLLRFQPEPGWTPPEPAAPARPEPEPPARPEPPPEPFDQRRAVWSFIARAPAMNGGGERVGEATSAVAPWPHQVRAFHRMYDNWPPRLLIGDEVGLGKTIQAGLLLRQAWLAGRAKRILILAPKAVLRQWQLELREKFNLNWPIYDGQKLRWVESPALRGQHERAVGPGDWHQEPVVIASSHLMRRRERATALLEAEPWDLVVLDEAHHARRHGAGSASEGGPNALLRLIGTLCGRTSGLVLLTATPMQVHPVEVWDLLNLLGLPPEWTKDAFLSFFDDAAHPNPSYDAMERMAALFRATERHWGRADAGRPPKGLGERKMLAALRGPAATPRRQLEAGQRRAAVAFMARNTPVARLVSRNTRQTLLEYQRAGALQAQIAERQVEDRFIALSPDERAIYEAVEHYISTTYQRASSASVQQRNAVGFVMTIYRRRLASSFHALRQTLAGRMAALGAARAHLGPLDEEVDDDDPNAPDEDDAKQMAKEALVGEERSGIEAILAMVNRLPPDTKAGALRAEISALRADGYKQAMVFTQFTDTMDMLRDGLARDGAQVICFSGRGGEVPAPGGGWRTVTRDDVKGRFRDGRADVLLCTDAAAEGLNFQFCGALVNYDCPWNPMRIEQRIGRIDRLGQQFERIRVVNLHYQDTVEADVYDALRRRIGLFNKVVGSLQPILAQAPRLIGQQVLSGGRDGAAAAVERAADTPASGFDLDAAAAGDESTADRTEPLLALAELQRLLGRPDLLPPGTEAERYGASEWRLSSPGLPGIRVTTDPAFFEAHADSVEFWSPGGPGFPSLEPAGGEASFDPGLLRRLGL